MELIINGAKTEIGHNELVMILNALSDSPRHAPFLRTLKNSPYSTVRRIIATKNCIDAETAEALLKDSDIEVLRSVVWNDAFQTLANQKTLLELLSVEDEELSKNILRVVGNGTFDVRVDLEKIFATAVGSTNPAIRLAAAECFNIPPQYLIQLTKDQDADVRDEACKHAG